MSTYFRLLSMQMNQRYGFSAFRATWRENKKRAFGQTALALVVVIALASLVGMYVWILNAITPSFVALGMEKLQIGAVLLTAMVFVFIMGMIYLIGILYFSKDTEFLASLPIRQRTVFAVKFSQVLLGEIGVTLVMLLPFFVVYGIHANVSALFWVRALLVTLFAACIPLALSALCSLLLMRISVLWRRRDLFTTIGSIVLLAGVLVGQMYLTSRIPSDISPEMIMTFIADNSALLSSIVSAFPPSGWAANGLLHGGGQLLLFVALSIASLLVVVWIAGRMYYRGAMAQAETASSQRAVSFSGRAVRRRGPLLALFLREWKTTLRSPVYAMNGLLVIIVGPIMLLMPKIMQGAASGDEFSALFALLEGAVNPYWILLALAGVFMLLSMISPAVTTSLSREGSNFYLLRLMPVTPTRQVMAKFLFGYSIAFLSILFMGVTAMLLFGFSTWVVLGAFAAGMLGSIAPLSLSMIPDMLYPKLSWNSETEAIKQNRNGIIGMLIGWGYLVPFVFAAIKLIQADVGAEMVFIGFLVLSVVLGAAGLLALTAAARRGLHRIEG